MAKGRIVSYDEDRGHGLIQRTDEPERIYFNTGEFEDEGRPFEGQHVTFELEQGRAGPRATHVHPVRHHQRVGTRVDPGRETPGETTAKRVRDLARTPETGPRATTAEPGVRPTRGSEDADPELDELGDHDEDDEPVIEDGKDRPHGGP